MQKNDIKDAKNTKREDRWNLSMSNTCLLEALEGDHGEGGREATVKDMMLGTSPHL